MQNYMQLNSQYSYILQEIKKNLDIKSFCELHSKSESQIYRILQGKCKKIDLELIDYMCMNCDLEISLTIKGNTYPKPGKPKYSLKYKL